MYINVNIHIFARDEIRHELYEEIHSMISHGLYVLPFQSILKDHFTTFPYPNLTRPIGCQSLRLDDTLCWFPVATFEDLDHVDKRLCHMIIQMFLYIIYSYYIGYKYIYI